MGGLLCFYFTWPKGESSMKFEPQIFYSQFDGGANGFDSICDDCHSMLTEPFPYVGFVPQT